MQDTTTKESIGTKKESSLHKALKYHYAGSTGLVETEKLGYICDALNETGEFIEVQTGSFKPLIQKVLKISCEARIKIVHPIIINRFIELYSSENSLIRKRKSPRGGTIWDLFSVLLYAPELPKMANVCIEVVFVDIIEKRIQDGKGSWRRKGISLQDKELKTIHSMRLFSSLDDYLALLPYNKNEEFTVKDLADCTKDLKADLSRKVLYVFHKLGLVERCGKKGNSWIYRLC